MEQTYKRVENIDDKVKDARLPYQEWKVLFLLGEQSDVAEISSLLSDDSSSVSNIFESLESKGLIEKVASDEEPDETAAAIEEPSVPSFGDELLMEEDEKSEEAIPETEVEEANIEPEVQQPEEIEPIQELTESADKEKFEVNTDFLDENLLPKDETISSGASTMKSPLDEPEAQAEMKPSETEFDLDLDEENVTTVEEPALEESSEENLPEPEVVPEAGTEEETISDVSKKTIMVIDDSIVIRKMIEIALEDEDFNIVTAISGKDGLDNIESQQPNLVILDMLLPDMNGIDVLKTIKSEKKIPVIMLSGKDSPQLIESAKELGVDDFLPKPFRDEELVEKVRTLVGV